MKWGMTGSGGKSVGAAGTASLRVASSAPPSPSLGVRLIVVVPSFAGVAGGFHPHRLFGVFDMVITKHQVGPKVVPDSNSGSQARKGRIWRQLVGAEIEVVFSREIVVPNGDHVRWRFNRGRSDFPRLNDEAPHGPGIEA